VSSQAGAGPVVRQIPNVITLVRLLALPVLVVVLIAAPGPTSLAAGLIFAAVGATDYLDGWLARRLGAESAFGRIADPLADRLLVAVGLVGLVLLDRVNWAAPTILIGRDVLLIAGFVLVAHLGVLMRVDFAGKVSSALTMIATGACLLVAGWWAEALLWAAVVLALATGARYAAEATRSVRARVR
jgi:CDP-diacylglycerol---glycerol-3-phosphate 3-phosphatidyltransferase